jgi:hypothetical protein
MLKSIPPVSLNDLEDVTDESMLEELNTALTSGNEVPEHLIAKIREKLLQLKELLTSTIDILNEMLIVRKKLLELSQKLNTVEGKKIRLLQSVNAELNVEPLGFGARRCLSNELITPTFTLSGELQRERVNRIQELMGIQFDTYDELQNVRKAQKFAEQFSLTDKIYALTVLSDMESKSSNILLLLILAGMDTNLARSVFNEILEITLINPAKIDEKAFSNTEQQIEYAKTLLEHVEKTLKQFSLFGSNNQ